MKTGVRRVTTKDVAEALGISPRAVTKRAAKSEWVALGERLRGGGHVYDADALPLSETDRKKINGWLQKRFLAAALKAGGGNGNNLSAPLKSTCKTVAAKKDEPMELTALKGWQRRIFDARLALFREFEHLQRMLGTNKAVTVLVSMASDGTLPEPLQRCVTEANARPGQGRTLSRSMILGWQRAVRQGGVGVLAPKATERTDEPPWAQYFLPCYQQPGNPSIPQAMEEMARLLPPNISMPTYHQVLRWHNKRSRLLREKGRKTGSAYQALKAFRRRDTSGYRPLTVGQCDGHSWKGYVAHPVTGLPFHPEVCAVLDCATRFAVGWSAGLAESALTVAAAVRNAAEVSEKKPFGGIFDIIYCDNGAGNTARQNINDETGLFTRIGTTIATGRPGNPQGRGLIERSNQSIWIYAARRLPAFTGQSMDKGARRNMYLAIQKDFRQKHESELIPSWRQFQALCQEAVDAYNDRPHSALPKITDKDGKRRHMTPRECWAWHIADGWDMAEHQFTPAEIECLWLPREKRRVRRASVQLGANWYVNGRLAHYDGLDVQVAYYPTDASRVQVWNEAGQLICHAELDKNLTDMFPASMVERAAKERMQRRAALKEQQLQAIMDEARGVIEIGAKAPCKVISFDQTQRERVAAARAELAAREAERPFTLPDNDRDMVRLWHKLDRRVAAGAELAGRELQFYENFPQSEVFQAFQEVERDLGLKQA